jgi:hypothetical protein
MKNRRSKIYFLKTPFVLHFISIALVYICLLILVNLYSSWMIIKELKNCGQGSSSWWIHSLISQLSFSGAILILLITMLVLLHRSLGAIPRIEGILDRVNNGEYSLRVTVRKKDIIYSFVHKINKIIDLLDKKVKG